MLICHSIVLGNQLQLEKFLKQLKDESADKDHNLEIYNTLADLNMSQIRNLSSLTLVPLFSQSLQMSIQCKLISVACEILDFSKKQKLDLFILQSNLDVLVNDEMYFLMQKMIN